MDLETNYIPLSLRKHGDSLIFDIGGRYQRLSNRLISTKLQLLQHFDLTLHSNVKFLIWPNGPISAVFQDLIETIECCSRKGCSFHRFIWHEYDIFDPTHLAVLRAVCHYRLFRCLHFSSIANDPLNESTLHVLKGGMTMNKDLVEIFLYLEVSGTSLGILGDGLRETKSLKSLSIALGSPEMNNNFQQPPSNFLQGLNDNDTLTSLHLASLPTAAWTQEILKALLNNSTLETLSVTKSSWASSNIVALDSLLASSQCKISTLDLSNPRPIGRQTLKDNLADILKKNQSIQALTIRQLGLDDGAFSKLWEEFSALKGLPFIDVWGNEITSLRMVKSKMAGLKTLDLGENPILEMESSQAETKSGLSEFLEAHTELQFLGRSFAESNCYSPKLQHMLDRNANGRFLFGIGDDCFAHSWIWPRVLERANSNFKEHPVRQASVLYDSIRDISGSL